MIVPDIRKYDFIDALRGYAILLVVLVHSSGHVAPVNSILKLIAQEGARGVQLFYIASALTLCMSWEFRKKHEVFPLRNFFLRRFFRIAPMFYVALIFYVIWEGFAPRYWAPNGIEWWFIPLTALFIHGFNPETINSVVPGGWSIAVEMTFYLILPFLLNHLKNNKSLVLFFTLSVFIYISSRYLLLHLLLAHYPSNQQYLISSFAFLNFFGQLPVFATGLLAYSVFKNQNKIKTLVCYSWLILIIIITVTVLLKLPIKIINNHIFIGIIFAFLALTLSIYPIRILVNRIVIQLGKISFSMYLTHFFVLDLFQKLGINTFFKTGDVSSMLYYLCVIIATASLSYILYLTIERKGIFFGKRLIDRLEQKSFAIP
jgi:peptidoglycan/LPS O-acetylase OafA/YrhL